MRFRIVETLASGPHSAGILAEAIGPQFGISRSAVSHQLVRIEENPLADPPRRHRLRQRVVPHRRPTEEEVEPRAQGTPSGD